jgi:hypothetical protein
MFFDNFIRYRIKKDFIKLIFELRINLPEQLQQRFQRLQVHVKH